MSSRPAGRDPQSETPAFEDELSMEREAYRLRSEQTIGPAIAEKPELSSNAEQLLQGA
jgi:hypothetical protein